MKKICAWCKNDLGKICSQSHGDEIISHGLCDACSHKILMEMDIPFQDFMNSLDAPVVVVDSDRNVLSANTLALDLLGINGSDYSDYKAGDILQCVYASHPGGCGGTVHCNGCTIKSTVMDTYQTGKSHISEPSYVNRKTPEGVERISLHVSTEKVSRFVFLRIDSLESE